MTRSTGDLSFLSPFTGAASQSALVKILYGGSGSVVVGSGVEEMNRVVSGSCVVSGGCVVTGGRVVSNGVVPCDVLLGISTVVECVVKITDIVYKSSNGSSLLQSFVNKITMPTTSPVRHNKIIPTVTTT